MSLYRDPQGERIFTKLSNLELGNVTRKKSELVARVKELEDILSKSKV